MASTEQGIKIREQQEKEVEHEILHGTETGSDVPQHTKHVAPLPVVEQGDALPGLSGGGVAAIVPAEPPTVSSTSDVGIDSKKTTVISKDVSHNSINEVEAFTTTAAISTENEENKETNKETSTNDNSEETTEDSNITAKHQTLNSDDISLSTSHDSQCAQDARVQRRADVWEESKSEGSGEMAKEGGHADINELHGAVENPATEDADSKAEGGDKTKDEDQEQGSLVDKVKEKAEETLGIDLSGESEGKTEDVAVVEGETKQKEIPQSQGAIHEPVAENAETEGEKGQEAQDDSSLIDKIQKKVEVTLGVGSDKESAPNGAAAVEDKDESENQENGSLGEKVQKKVEETFDFNSNEKSTKAAGEQDDVKGTSLGEKTQEKVEETLGTGPVDKSASAANNEERDDVKSMDLGDKFQKKTEETFGVELEVSVSAAGDGAAVGAAAGTAVGAVAGIPGGPAGAAIGAAIGGASGVAVGAITGIVTDKNQDGGEKEKKKDENIMDGVKRAEEWSQDGLDAMVQEVPDASGAKSQNDADVAAEEGHDGATHEPEKSQNATVGEIQEVKIDTRGGDAKEDLGSESAKVDDDVVGKNQEGAKVFHRKSQIDEKAPDNVSQGGVNDSEEEIVDVETEEIHDDIVEKSQDATKGASAEKEQRTSDLEKAIHDIAGGESQETVGRDVQEAAVGEIQDAASGKSHDDAKVQNQNDTSDTDVKTEHDKGTDPVTKNHGNLGDEIQRENAKKFGVNLDNENAATGGADRQSHGKSGAGGKAHERFDSVTCSDIDFSPKAGAGVVEGTKEEDTKSSKEQISATTELEGKTNREQKSASEEVEVQAAGDQSDASGEEEGKTNREQMNLTKIMGAKIKAEDTFATSETNTSKEEEGEAIEKQTAATKEMEVGSNIEQKDATEKVEGKANDYQADTTQGTESKFNGEQTDVTKDVEIHLNVEQTHATKEMEIKIHEEQTETQAKIDTEQISASLEMNTKATNVDGTDAYAKDQKHDEVKAQGGEDPSKGTDPVTNNHGNLGDRIQRQNAEKFGVNLEEDM